MQGLITDKVTIEYHDLLEVPVPQQRYRTVPDEELIVLGRL
jgi:hypothetical protein